MVDLGNATALYPLGCPSLVGISRGLKTTCRCFKIMRCSEKVLSIEAWNAPGRNNLRWHVRGALTKSSLAKIAPSSQKKHLLSAKTPRKNSRLSPKNCWSCQRRLEKTVDLLRLRRQQDEWRPSQRGGEEYRVSYQNIYSVLHTDLSRIWKVKKLIKRLEAARGNGTSMISLIIRMSHDGDRRYRVRVLMSTV